MKTLLKHSLGVFLILALLLSLFTVTASADDTPTANLSITADKETYAPGDTVTFTVSLNNAVHHASICTALAADPALTYQSHTLSNTYSTWTTSYNVYAPGSGVEDADAYILVRDKNNNYAGTSASGELYKISFSIADDAADGDYTFEIVEGDHTYYRELKSSDPMPIKTTSCTITVGSDDPGGGPVEFTDSEAHITRGGDYALDASSSGAIFVDTAEAVSITGPGVDTKLASLSIYCTVAGADLTIKDLSTLRAYTGYTYTNSTVGYAYSAYDNISGIANVLHFTGEGNTLTVKGQNHFENDVGALVHVGQYADLTIEGDGELYLYKKGAWTCIGGNGSEGNGPITIDMDGGKLFALGNAMAATIGTGSYCNETPSDITIKNGELYLASNARGAVIGTGATDVSKPGVEYPASTGNVYIHGGLVNINVDWTGPAFGGEGDGNLTGNLVITGGMLRTYLDNNAATYAWGGAEGVRSDIIATATTTNGTDPVYLMAFDITDLKTAATSFDVKVDGKNFYNGGAAQWCYVKENGKSSGGSNTVVSMNWDACTDTTNLYFFLPASAKTITVNGETFYLTFSDGAFTYSENADTYTVTVDDSISGGSIAVDPASAEEGTPITVTVTPEEGKQLVEGSLKYSADGGANYTEITAAEGVYSFALSAANVTVTAQFENIPDKTPPALTADTTDKRVGQSVEITFADDEIWRNAISKVRVNETALTGGQYAISAGKITFVAEVFTTPGDYTVTVTANGYSDATVMQTMNRSAAEELEEAKTAAKNALDTYKNPADYRDAQKTELSTAIAAGKAAIDNAADIDGVNNALTVAKAVMDNIKTDAQLTVEEQATALAEAKTTAKNELSNYKNPDDYREAQKTELTAAINAGNSAIDTADDIAAVYNALTVAKAAMDNIRTDAQLTAEEQAAALAEAKSTAKNTLDTYKNASDYREAQKAELTAAINAGKAAIDTADDIAAVYNALTVAKAAMDNIRTDAQLIAEEENAVVEKIKSSTEKTISIELGDSSSLSKTVLKAMKKSGKEVTFVKKENGKVLYSWTFDGSKVDDTMDKIDLSISFTTDNKAAIDKLAGDENSVYLSFTYAGELPAPALIKVYVGDKYKDGATLNLYYFNEKTKQAEEIAAGLTVKDGYVSFTLTHMSDYFLTENQISQNKIEIGDGREKEKTRSAATGGSSSLVIWSLICGAGIIGASYLLTRKKRSI